MLVRAHDKRIACEEEFSDSEDEGEGGRRNAASFKKVKRAKTEGEKEGEEKEKKGEEEAKGIYSFFSFSSHHSCCFVTLTSFITLNQITVCEIELGLVVVMGFFFSICRSERRGESARRGEDGHLKVRKHCTHLPMLSRKWLVGGVNFLPYCGSFRPKEESKTP